MKYWAKTDFKLTGKEDNNMDFALYFLVGAAFGWLVIPAFKLWLIKRKEMHVSVSSADAETRKQALHKLVAHIKELQPENVRTIAIVVQDYEEEKSFCGFGGSVEDIVNGINLMAGQVVGRVPGLQVSNTLNKGD